MKAARNGHIEVVDKLLQHGARVDLQKEVSYNTLHMHYETQPTCRVEPVH